MLGIQGQINRIQQNIENTYAVMEALGADLPEEQTSDNLSATAGTAKPVLYKEQTLTEDEKAQARANIGAAAVGEGGGGGVNPDWSQGDTTQADYIKNRTHHDAWSPVVVDSVVTCEPGDDFTANFGLLLNTALVEGKTYTIRFDGKTYTSVCKNGGDGSLYLGSDSFFENLVFEDENDMFCIMDMGEFGCAVGFNEVVTEVFERHLLIVQGENTYTYISTEGHFFNLASSGLGFLYEIKIPHEDVMKGMTIQAVIDGQEKTLTSDVLTFVEAEDCVVVGYGGSPLVAVGKWSSQHPIEGIWVDLITNQEATVKSIDFVSPVFVPSLELKKLDEKFLPESVESVIIRSSTEGSTKKFKITVDDSGTITATEVT